MAGINTAIGIVFAAIETSLYVESRVASEGASADSLATIFD